MSAPEVSKERAGELVAGVVMMAHAIATGTVEDAAEDWISWDPDEIFSQVVGTCAMISLLDGSADAHLADDGFWLIEAPEQAEGTPTLLALRLLACHRNGDLDTSLALWHGDGSMAQAERAAEAFVILLRIAAQALTARSPEGGDR